MKITKIFRVEASHRVYNCFTNFCKFSNHGHSYVIEVSLEGTALDHAGMILDFGLLKGPVKEFIEGFDHCHMINKYGYPEEVEFFKKFNDRWISIPFNASAEMMSLMFLRFIQRIISQHSFENGGDPNLKVVEVTVHETVTGRATSTVEDLKLWREEWDNLFEFSEGVVGEWSKDLIKILEDPNHKVIVDTPEQQICVPHF